jgi:hypothetical protein
MNKQQIKDFEEHHVEDERGGYRITERYAIFIRELNAFNCVVRDGVRNFYMVYGCIIFEAGHWWNGASGISIDSKSAIKSSLVHDAIYDMIEINPYLKEDEEFFRKVADDVFYRLLKRNGMWSFRARLWYFAVRFFGGFYLGGKNK